jgi:hypothetical protein
MIKHVRELARGAEIRVNGFWCRVATEPEPTARTVWVYGERLDGAVAPFAFSNDESVECR